MTMEWQDMADYGFPGVWVRHKEVDGRPRIVGIRIERPEGLVDGDVPIRHLETILANVVRRDAVAEPESIRVGVTVPPTRRGLRIPKRLRVPERRRLSDDFYRRVADLYSWCAVSGVAPAPALSEANDVAETTVHAWVKEARRRGVLAPARKQGSTG
jgi:hypothetical protein